MLIDINKTIVLLIDKLQSWFDATVLILPNLVLSLIVFLLFVGFAGLSKKAIDRLLSNVRTADNMKGILKSLVTMVIYLAGAFSALEILGLEKTVTSILAGAGLIGLAISLAFQNIAANVISGIIISFRHPFRIGDYIQCSENVFGKVIKINIPNTILINDEGQYITVPNKEIWERNIINYSQYGKREVEVKIAIGMNTDLDLAILLAKKAIDTVPNVVQKDQLDIFYTNINTYSIELSVNFWVNFKEMKDYEFAKSDAIKTILGSFRQHGIEIPYPVMQILK